MEKTIRNMVVYSSPIYTGIAGGEKWAIEVDYFGGNPDLFEFDTQQEQLAKAKELRAV